MVEFPDVIVDIIAEYTFEHEHKIMSIKINYCYIHCVEMIYFNNTILAEFNKYYFPEEKCKQYQNIDKIKNILISNADFMVGKISNILCQTVDKKQIIHSNIYVQEQPAIYDCTKYDMCKKLKKILIVIILNISW